MKKKRITNKRNEELDKKRWEKGRREEGGGNDKGRNIRNEWSNIKVYNQTKEKQKLTRGIQTKKKRREKKKQRINKTRGTQRGTEGGGGGRGRRK